MFGFLNNKIAFSLVIINFVLLGKVTRVCRVL